MMRSTHIYAILCYPIAYACILGDARAAVCSAEGGRTDPGRRLHGVGVFQRKSDDNDDDDDADLCSVTIISYFISFL